MTGGIVRRPHRLLMSAFLVSFRKEPFERPVNAPSSGISGEKSAQTPCAEALLTARAATTNSVANKQKLAFQRPAQILPFSIRA